MASLDRRLLILPLLLLLGYTGGCERGTTTLELAFLTVQVVDGQGLPVANARVEVAYTGGSTSSSGTTGENGRFTDRLLYGQEIRVTVTPPAGYVLAPDQQNPRTFTFSPTTAELTVVLNATS